MGQWVGLVSHNRPTEGRVELVEGIMSIQRPLFTG